MYGHAAVADLQRGLYLASCPNTGELFFLVMATLLAFAGGSPIVFAQTDAAHEKCLKAADYKGCIESQGLSKKR